MTYSAPTQVNPEVRIGDVQIPYPKLVQVQRLIRRVSNGAIEKGLVETDDDDNNIGCFASGEKPSCTMCNSGSTVCAVQTGDPIEYLCESCVREVLDNLESFIDENADALLAEAL